MWRLLGWRREPAQVRQLGQSTVDAQGQRAAALRFGDERVMALLAAIAQFAHLPRGLSNRTVRQQVAALLGDPTYSSAQMPYDLRRLRLKGLLERVPQSHTYVLSALSINVSQFYTKLYTRLFRPGLAALEPPPCVPGALARALNAVADEIDGLVIAAQLGRSSAS